MLEQESLWPFKVAAKDHFQHLPIYEGYDNHYQHQGGDEHRGVGGVAGSVRDIKEQIQ